jgi:hypothetical protein
MFPNISFGGRERSKTLAMEHQIQLGARKKSQFSFGINDSEVS